MSSRKQRWPRSFRRRQGQATRAQKQALREQWGHWGITWSFNEVLDLNAHFGFDGPTVLDIGFGHGDTTLAIAKARPDWRVLGIEVHLPALGATLLKLAESGTENVRLIRGDVLELLTDHLTGDTLDEVLVCFPDPFPGDSEAERRLIRAAFLEALEQVLVSGGVLHVVTDVAEYAAHTRAMLERPNWRVVVSEPARPAWRPTTHYEARAQAAGDEIHEMRFQFQSD